jgi:hypothetical protein
MDYRGDYFRFGSVFIKKNIIKPNFFKKKLKPNRTGSNRFGSVFSVLALFFPIWLSFFGLARFFSGLALFFPVFFDLGSVQFDFRLIKSKLNRTGRFFQNFNRFFFTVRFFRFSKLFKYAWYVEVTWS